MPLAGDVLATIETRHEALTFHWQPASGRVVKAALGLTSNSNPSPGTVMTSFDTAAVGSASVVRDLPAVCSMGSISRRVMS